MYDEKECCHVDRAHDYIKYTQVSDINAIIKIFDRLRADMGNKN